MDIKVCPVCDRDDKVEITTSEHTYIEAYKENGDACLSIRCWRCALELYDHTPFGIDGYERKKEVLIKKWNSIPRREVIDDGK